ncbi:MAG: sugar ABC transporter permease [Chloroflexi bacterium]|nr:MAG: sugar ABC transporter permease [Chloroflexota bacterium]
MRRANSAAYLFLFPGFFAIILTTILPVFSVINLSFQEWQITRSKEPLGYIGLENYIRAFKDVDFWNSVLVTFWYTVITVFFSVAIGLFCAIVLQKTNWASGIIKSLLIFPFAISLVLRGYSFRFMLLEGQGILDTIIDFLIPIPAVQETLWLANPGTALFWISVPIFWSWGPLCGLMILGALNNISPEIFEAARVDGAKPVRIFWSITFPLLRPMILVMVLLVTLFSIRVFDVVHTMTAGGPGRATEILNYYIFRVGFQIFDMGYASALSIILTIILMVLAYFYSRILID